MTKLLGITVLGDFIVSEGVSAVMENLRRVGATAAAVNPTVTAEGDENHGKWQPPADAGHSPRTFDRPLFGKTALWLRSGPSFRPNARFYADSPYAARQTNDLTDEFGPLIGKFIDRCDDEGIDVYLQIGAAEPTGLRDEDRPRLPSGDLPRGRIADTASLASPAVRAYNRAYVSDLLTAYPNVSGLRIDWPEYPCYTPDEVFQDFSPHVAVWAESNGIDFQAIRAGVAQFIERIRGALTNEEVIAFAQADEGAAAFQNWLGQFPAVGQWLNLKSMLSTDLVRDWRAIVDALPSPKKLSLHAFMPPFSSITGFDFSAAAELGDSISPKLYTMHWRLMLHEWDKWLLANNPNLDEVLLTQALANLLALCDEPPGELRLDDFAYPLPDEPHGIGVRAQSAKLQAVRAAVGERAGVFPLVHGYGPADDFAARFCVAWEESDDGVWVNRYGYLSNEKLDLIHKCVAEMS